MINQSKLNNLLAACTLALVFASSPLALAADKTAEVAADTNTSVEAAKQDQTAEKRKKILQEATQAIRETQNALKALDENNSELAIEALESATGKLQIILAREPSLALAPSDVSVVTYDVLASIDDVRILRDQAEDALEEGRLQDARQLIGDLASETVISTTNIPLATYPDAIKLATALIDEGKIKEAQAALQTALSTLVVTDVVIPLPVVTAESLLQDAESLTEKADRTEDENKRLTQLLDAAQTELKFAEALGYGSKKDFKNLHEQLDLIAEQTEDGKSGEGFFDKIKQFLTETIGSSQHEKAG